MTRFLENHNRWEVSRSQDFLQWCAWRSWLHRETQRTFFPEKLVVWSEWPPTTMDAARKVIGAIADARREEQSSTSHNENYQPWLSWTNQQCQELLDRHRDDFWWNPKLPDYAGKNRRLGPVKSPDEIRLDAYSARNAANIPHIQKGEKFENYRKRIAGWDKG